MAKSLPGMALAADLLLRHQGGLGAFIDAQRGEQRSWDTIAKQLYHLTNGAIDVTDVTVQSWAQRLDEMKAAS